jgi:HSP20 family protein
MKTQAVTKFTERMPALFEDFFKPWNELFDGRLLKREMNVPAVNVAEHKDH